MEGQEPVQTHDRCSFATQKNTFVLWLYVSHKLATSSMQIDSRGKMGER